MMTLITGGSGSGKSAFAEEYALALPHSSAYYLATMEVRDGESRKRVQRHRENRKNENWRTLEYPRDVAEAVHQLEGHHPVLLLECMSNLVANEMYRENSVETAEYCREKILRNLRTLATKTTHLVIVTNNVFDDGSAIDDGLRDYMTALGRINLALAKEADEVVEVVVGIPIYWKRRNENA